MSSFWLGFTVGAIASPLILAALSKPLMNWFMKRKANQFGKAVLGNLQDNFNDLNDKKEEEDAINKEEEKDY